MPTFTHSSKLDHSPADVFEWHERPGAFERLAPPWEPVRLEKHEGIREGDRAYLRLGWGRLSVPWVALHTAYREGTMFEDVQQEGPFERWRHRHVFESDGDSGTRMSDEIEYEVPLGGVGEALGGGCVSRRLREQFRYRHRIVANDLELHRRYTGTSLTVAISGSSGLLGSALKAFLTTGGHRVLRLVRRVATSADEVRWSPGSGQVDTEKLEGIDAVVHLAGESIFAPRWTEAKKKRIYDSRVAGTRLLANAIAGLDNPPAVLVSSSAIGIYGDRGSDELIESSDLDHESFLARVCIDWEAAAEPARKAGLRTVFARTGLVLSGAGGALAPMLPLFKAGLGGRLGIPEAYLSWIALDDVIGAIYHAIRTPEISGPMNVTAPGPVTWNDFAPALGDVLNRPTFVTVPEWLTKLTAGEVADNVLLPSTRVLPGVLQDSGYSFLFNDLVEALRHQLGRTAGILS